MPTLGLKKVRYSDSQQTLMDVVNKNFQIIEWMLANGKLDGTNLNEVYLEEFIASRAVIDELWSEIVRVEQSLVTNNFYAESAYIASLTVDELDTSDKVRNFLVGNTSDVNYIKIYNQQIDHITAQTDGSAYEQVTDRNGALLYWIDNTNTGITTEPTDFPVYQYVYTEYVKNQYGFFLDTESGQYLPMLELGTGTGVDNNSKGYIYKGQTGLYIKYITSLGVERSIRLTDEGIDFSDFDSIDFSQFAMIANVEKAINEANQTTPSMEDFIPFTDENDGWKMKKATISDILRSESVVQNYLRYVNNVTGSDTTGDGTRYKPYATIAKAIADVPDYLNANGGLYIRLFTTATPYTIPSLNRFWGEGAINIAKQNHTYSATNPIISSEVFIENSRQTQLHIELSFLDFEFDNHTFCYLGGKTLRIDHCNFKGVGNSTDGYTTERFVELYGFDRVIVVSSTFSNSLYAFNIYNSLGRNNDPDVWIGLCTFDMMRNVFESLYVNVLEVQGCTFTDLEETILEGNQINGLNILSYDAPYGTPEGQGNTLFQYGLIPEITPDDFMPIVDDSEAKKMKYASIRSLEAIFKLTEEEKDQLFFKAGGSVNDLEGTPPVTYDGFTLSTEAAHDGVQSLKLAGGGDGATTVGNVYLTTTHDGTLAFYYLVSTEQGYDFVSIAVDSVPLKSGLSGDGVWELCTYECDAGSHTITVTYEKDSSVNENLDAVFIDSITMPDGTFSYRQDITWHTNLENFAGKANKILAVNSTEDGVVLVSPSTPVSGHFDYGSIADATTTSFDWGSL